MNINPIPSLQLNFNLPSNFPHSQQLSPLARKNIFSRPKKTISPQSTHFNPHLEKLTTNYYLKDNAILPYSYTAPENPMSLHSHSNPYQHLLKTNKTKTSASKVLSLKEFSCIQTVSEKTGKQNDSNSNSELQISRTFQPNQIHSDLTSPFDSLNFKSSFTSPNLDHSELNFIKSHQIPKFAKHSTQTDAIPIKYNKIKLFNHETENDRKTHKIHSHKKYKTPNFTLSTHVFDIKISPIKKGLSFSKSIDVHESSVIFDYNKFYKTNNRSPEKQPSLIFHPINQKIFKFFGQEKHKVDNLRISNQNDSFIDIVKQINSPESKAHYQQIFIEKEHEKASIQSLIEQKNSLFSSELTCLVKEGPRSCSMGNDLRKLSGHKNNFTQSKKESLPLKTQTRPTSGRSEFFNQFELNTPIKASPQKPEAEFTQSNKINFAPNFITKTSPSKIAHIPQDRQFVRNLFTENNKSSPKNLHCQNPSIERASNSKDSKKSSRKGISVLSKEKKKLDSQPNGNQRPTQNIVMASKLKSLQEIKNMKKLSLDSPRKIDTYQAGSPIRYKEQ